MRDPKVRDYNQCACLTSCPSVGKSADPKPLTMGVLQVLEAIRVQYLGQKKQKKKVSDAAYARMMLANSHAMCRLSC